MTTTNINTENLSVELVKALALRIHLGDPFFLLECEDGETIAYEGTEEDAREQFEADIEGTEEVDIDLNFAIFCQNNLTQIEEYDEDNYDNNYMVLTDEEADEKWEESLNSYLDDCIYPELPDNMKNYFDDEKWKRDARYDGRGHSLSSYDGNENEETIGDTTCYIYRIN